MFGIINNISISLWQKLQKQIFHLLIVNSVFCLCHESVWWMFLFAGINGRRHKHRTWFGAWLVSRSVCSHMNYGEWLPGVLTLVTMENIAIGCHGECWHWLPYWLLMSAAKGNGDVSVQSGHSHGCHGEGWCRPTWILLTWWLLTSVSMRLLID